MGRSPWDDAPLSDRDHDAAGPIGKRRVEEEISLTRIEKSPDGVYEYGPEVPATERFDEPQESFTMKYGKNKTTPARHSWIRLVIRAKKADGHIQEGDHLVLTRLPYSTGWACFRPFKKPTKDASRVSLPEAFPSAVDFVRAVEDLPNDYFERGSYWTAGISYPCEPFLDDATNRQEDAQRVYGICRDPLAVETALVASPEVLKLFDQTKKGTIRIGFQNSHKPYDEIKDNAGLFMTCSIRQALAGPEDDSLKTRAVLKQVDRNYRDHLENANRVFDSHRKRKAEFDDWLEDNYRRHLKKWGTSL